jgi:DnaJ-class molecular chaperone
MSDEQWQVVTCPDCNGKKQKYVAYEEEYHSGYEDCYTCKGRGLVKIDRQALLDRLEEYRP